MTEKEKMLAHKMYDANYDKELLENRRKITPIGRSLFGYICLE